MFRNLLNAWLSEHTTEAFSSRAGRGLQIVLWTIWTLAIVAVAYINWHADIVAQRPLNLLGLVIHCMVVGVLGLVVLTKIEMYAQPWRFVGDRPRDRR